MSMKALTFLLGGEGVTTLTWDHNQPPKMNNKMSFIRWKNRIFWSSFDIKPIKGLKYGMNARESKHILTCSYVWESKGRTPKLNTHFEIKSLWGVLNLWIKVWGLNLVQIESLLNLEICWAKIIIVKWSLIPKDLHHKLWPFEEKLDCQIFNHLNEVLRGQIEFDWKAWYGVEKFFSLMVTR
jgi:hypothetical protein